jgi:Uma2 family endonuclease
MAIAEAEIAEAEQDIVPYTGRPITEEELMRLPHDGRKWEMEDGRLTEVPTNFFHDAIGINLIGLMLPYTRKRGFMSSGQAGFHTSDDDIRAPDVSFTRKERIPGGIPPNSFGVNTPDLCVEIISLSERREQMTRKVQEYFDGGAVQVWHVFPERQEVVVFTSPADTQTLGAGDVLDAGGLLPGFSCRVSDLFDLE